jgi:hypothetical protein
VLPVPETIKWALAFQPTAHLNLWKQHLGHVPESVWERVDLETIVLADNDQARGCLVYR